MVAMANKNRTAAITSVDDGLAEKEAEILPLGPLAGDNPGSDPVAGTTPVLGVGVDVLEPSDWGAGAGAKVESLITVVGGATRGGNCCRPTTFFLT